MAGVLVALAVAGALVALLVIGGVFLLKLGVITHYAVKPKEPPDTGDYGLDQSHEPADE